jgi:ATP-dependent RNA helicase DeaD
MPVAEPHPHRPAVTFGSLGLSKAVARGIKEAGYTSPLPVQSACAIPALAGCDLIVRSRTGSGKTLAFAAPILSMLDYRSRAPQALVLEPTRELALQVHQEFEKIAVHTRLKSVAVYGGTGFGKQLDMLKHGVQLVVGTPGRILDHRGRGTLDLSRVRVLVLDEADEMLSAGFYEDILDIFDSMPALEQVLLFSATLPPNIGKMIDRYMRDPVQVDLSTDRVDVERIENVVYRLNESGLSRQQLLVAVLESEDPGAAIVFCNTKAQTESVTAYLRRRGFDAGLINSNLTQSARERVMGRMKEGKHRLLVATDIAARGIDISLLPCVINYEPPDDPQLYIHRTGRTGRVDRKGRAITLLVGKDEVTMRRIVAQYGLKVINAETPTREETLKMLSDRRLREIKDKLGADRIIPDEFRSIAREILTDPAKEEILAMLIDSYLSAAMHPDASHEDRLPQEQSHRPGGGGRRRSGGGGSGGGRRR